MVSHQFSHLMVKVTNLPKTWFVHFYVLRLTLPVFLPLSLPGKVRGVGVAQSYMGTSVWALWSRPRHPEEPLLSCPLCFIGLLFLSPHLVKGGRADTLLSWAPSDRWGRRGLRCHWLTAGESAMRIGGCRGTGMKTCVRRRWCWWRSCASTPREATARVNAARSSATCWEVATDSWTQVTDTPGALHESFDNNCICQDFSKYEGSFSPLYRIQQLITRLRVYSHISGSVSANFSMLTCSQWLTCWC